MKKDLFILLLTLLFCGCGGRIGLTGLTVESQDGSQPLDIAVPRFGWHYERDLDSVFQTDYRIIVASTEMNARHGIGDLWDSKQVTSSRMLYIPYEGKALKSRDHCYWKVFATVRYGKKGKI